MNEVTHMTDEQLAIFLKVARTIAGKYSFGIYDAEDLVQECYLIALDGLKNYDGVRPLENFFAIHLSNRLKNFKRDNGVKLVSYYHSEDDWERFQGDKFRLMHALNIDLVAGAQECCVYDVKCDEQTDVERDEEKVADALLSLEYLTDYLPSYLRRVFLKMKAGNRISPNQYVELLVTLAGIEMDFVVFNNYEDV